MVVSKVSRQIDWDSATCISYSTDFYQRHTLESSFTNVEQMPDDHTHPTYEMSREFKPFTVSELFYDIDIVRVLRCYSNERSLASHYSTALKSYFSIPYFTISAVILCPFRSCIPL